MPINVQEQLLAVAVFRQRMQELEHQAKDAVDRYSKRWQVDLSDETAAWRELQEENKRIGAAREDALVSLVGAETARAIREAQWN